MDMREFHRALGDSLDALDRVKGVEEQVNAAQMRLNQKNMEIAALADAHAKLKADSDAHLATNLARMNEETVRHNNEVNELKKKLAALDELHQTQQENASNTLTHLNTQVGLARKDLESMQIKKEALRSELVDYAKTL